MQELTASSQQLNDIADDLQVGISAFKLINGNLLIPQGRTTRRAPVMPVTQAARRPQGRSATPEAKPAEEPKKGTAAASDAKRNAPKK